MRVTPKTFTGSDMTMSRLRRPAPASASVPDSSLELGQKPGAANKRPEARCASGLAATKRTVRQPITVPLTEMSSAAKTWASVKLLLASTTDHSA